MGLEPASGDTGLRVGADAGLGGHHFSVDDGAGVDLPQFHADEVEEAHAGVRGVGAKPKAAEIENDRQCDESQEQPEDNDSDENRLLRR
jgi:hypothetical protein